MKSLPKIEHKKIRYLLLYLVFLYALYLLGASPSLFLISAGIISLVIFGWLMYREYKESTIRITPVLVLFIVPFLMCGASAIYHGFFYLDEKYAELGPARFETSYTVVGFLMFSTGLFFQFLGIHIFRPPSSPDIKYKEKPKQLKLFKYFIFFLILSKVTELNLDLGMLQNYLSLLPLAILIFIVLKDRENILTSYSYKRNSVVIGSIILFISNLADLSKTGLVYSVVPVFLFYLVHSAKAKKYKVVIAITFSLTLYFIFIQPFVTNMRVLSTFQEQEITSDFLSSYVLSGEYITPLDIYRATDNPVEAFLQRMFEINAPAFIYAHTEREGFQMGKTFESISIGLIPRIIWPDKPDIPQGGRFAKEMFGFEKMSIGMLISGELYWNFGWTGIIIGSLLLGLLLGFLWKKLNAIKLKDFFYFTIYLNLLLSCLGGGEFSALFVGTLQLIIMFFLLRYFEKFIVHKIKLK